MSTNNKGFETVQEGIVPEGEEQVKEKQDSIPSGKNWNYARNKPIPKPIKLLTEEEIADSLAQSRAEQEQTRREEFIRARQSLYHLPGWSMSLIRWIILACSLSMLTVVCLSGVTFLFSLSVMPSYAAWLTGIALLLLLSALSYPIIKVIILFRKLQKKPDVELESLKILAERSNWHSLIHQERAKARIELKKYLDGYAINENRLSQLMKRSTNDGQAIDKLKQAREKLLDSNNPEGPDKWITNFRDDFQSILDKTACASVTYHSNRVFVYTASSQKPFLDSVITLYYSFAMMKELLEIYGCRPTWHATCFIMFRVAFGALVSGQTDKAFGDIVDNNIDLSAMMNEDTAMKLGGEALEGVLKMVFKSAAQGLINYTLLRRLGKACIRALQPAAPALEHFK